MADRNQLSRRGAFAMAAVFIASGVVPILVGLGVMRPSGDLPPAWVAVAAGLVFMCGGLAVAVDYGIAHGIGPDGDFPPDTPFAIRLANFLLGSAIVGLLTGIFGWVAFGPGPRTFSSTLSLPFLPLHRQSGEMSGRIAFGAATLLLAPMFVACGVSGVRRLMRAWRTPAARPALGRR
jgi:hypothetical protein